MNIHYIQTSPGVLHLFRLLILSICIIYMNIFSCGQNTFGAHANINSTSDSEFIHIIMWVALSVDGFMFLSRLFEHDDGTNETSILIHSAFGLIYFVAFIILLVSWIKCSDMNALFCNGQHKCLVHILPTIAALLLTIFYVYDDVRHTLESFHSF